MKPTCLSGTVDGLDDLDGLSCPGVSASHVHERSLGRGADGEFLTRRLQPYPDGMCEVIADKFLRTFQRMLSENSGPGGAVVSPSHPLT